MAKFAAAQDSEQMPMGSFHVLALSTSPFHVDRCFAAVIADSLTKVSFNKCIASEAFEVTIGPRVRTRLR